MVVARAKYKKRSVANDNIYVYYIEQQDSHLKTCKTAHVFAHALVAYLRGGHIGYIPP